MAVKTIKENNFSTLENLLRTNAELTTSQKEFGNNVATDIETMNARTRNDNSARDSQNRSRIALVLTWGFVIIVFCIIVLAPVYNATIGKDSQIDIGGLSESFNSIFGTVLGFVLGYYFKEKADGPK